MIISGKYIDVMNRRIFNSILKIQDGVIKEVTETQDECLNYILPGFIDSHIHIESSMVTPSAFAAEAVKHGTVATVSDPHEIANVCGKEGIEFMIKSGKKVPLKFYFGVPSCVPATSFETSGATIGSEDVDRMIKSDDFLYLSEMMNFPGVIYDDPDVLKKLNSAKAAGKKVDGHAPGLSGKDLTKYIKAGISTDHECSTLEEASEKIAGGMKVLIREGSAARNLDNLTYLIKTDPDMVMLCSDDLHPEMLIKGHINRLVSKLLCEGYDLFDVLRTATLNPVLHYGLGTGVLREGDPADFIIVDDLSKLNVLETWIDGIQVFCNNKVNFNPAPEDPINVFNCDNIHEKDIIIRRGGNKFRVIDAIEGELLTHEIIAEAGDCEFMESDTDNDYLKIIVKDRYQNKPLQIGFIKGFKLKNGAFASSVAHDSHNIICVGTNNIDILAAVNKVITMKGGLSTSMNGQVTSLQLGIGGIMSADTCRNTAKQYEKLNHVVRNMGCTMKAPFMTLAFMALLVIPELKIGDRGLFDVRSFRPVPLFLK